jgi:hypothetical protein
VKPKVLAAVIAAILLVGGGAFALTRLMGASEDEALAFVPQDAFLYANVFVRASNSQKMALDRLLRRFPGIDRSKEVIKKVTGLVDEELAEDGFDYDDDIDPWLDDQIAVYAAPGGTPELPNFALLVESRDDAILRDFIDESVEKEGVELEDRTYKGETYQMEKDGAEPLALAILDGFLVIGAEEAVKESIDTAANGQTLESEERFSTATDALRDDWIGLFYFDSAKFFSELAGAAAPAEQAALEAFGVGSAEPQAAVLYVTRDSVVFESSAGLGEGNFARTVAAAADPGLVPELPSDAWAAFGLPNLGEMMGGLFQLFAGTPGFDQTQIDALFYAETGLRLEQDVLSWLGDAGVFLQGSNFQEFGGGLVIESSDPAKTRRVVQKIEDLLLQQGLGPRPVSEGGLDGFSIQVPGSPAPVYVLGGDRLVVTYGPSATEDVTSGGDTLQDSDSFAAAQDAVGDDFAISFFVDVDAAQAFGESFAALSGAPMDTYEQDVKPYVDVFTHVVGAAKKEGDTIVQKFVIGFE